jgi:low temperature requirement protein LtrA
MTETTPAHPGRGVHWLELFFDLVMVVYINQIAHTLHGEPSWLDAAVFFAFLAAAWWAWVNATVTMNLFGLRMTPSIWITVTIAMVALGLMAAAVPDALGERAAAFAIGNAAIRLVWAVPWFIRRRTSGTPWWRSVLYSVVPATLWLISIAVAPPWQYVLWALAVAIEITLLSLIGRERTWLTETLDIDHLVERVGLLIVIVFGESIFTIVTQLNAQWTAAAGWAALLAFTAVSMLAWVFFVRASSAFTLGVRGLQTRGSVTGLRDAVMYLPFLMVAGITLFASALGTAVAEAGHPLPLGAAVCLSAGISLFSIASAAETLRYGGRLRDVATWAPSGIVLPWILIPLAAAVPSEVLVGVSVGVIAVLVAVTEVNVRRKRVS